MATTPRAGSPDRAALPPAAVVEVDAALGGAPGLRDAALGGHRRTPAGHTVPYYYTVLIFIRSLDVVAVDPGAILVPATGWVLDSYRAVLASPEDGGQGFLSFMRNSAVVAPAR
jgi:hypothetical protein